MGDLVTAIALLQKCFDKYAKAEGDSNTLSKKELAKLLNDELAISESKNKAEVDNFFKGLDGDGNGVIDFVEYATFVATLAILLKE